MTGLKEASRGEIVLYQAPDGKDKIMRAIWKNVEVERL